MREFDVKYKLLDAGSTCNLLYTASADYKPSTKPAIVKKKLNDFDNMIPDYCHNKLLSFSCGHFFFLLLTETNVAN